jgi:ribosomal protein S3AE
MAEKSKTSKVITRRRKFISVSIPATKSQIELIGSSPKEVEGRTIKLDLTRQLKGKGVEAVVRIKTENEKAVAYPFKMRLMPYFIRRMIRKRISYVEDSFETPSQESMIKVKPFLITRKRVSKAVRKTLRNKAKNWLEDYIASKKDDVLFNEVLSNKLQKPLSLVLKKTYPLSLCEVRVLEIKRPLAPEEIPKVKPKAEEPKPKKEKARIEEGLDQFQEIEEELKKKAEKEIKETQKKAAEKEKAEKKNLKEELEKAKEALKKKTTKSGKKETEKKKTTKKAAKKEE